MREMISQYGKQALSVNMQPVLIWQIEVADKILSASFSCFPRSATSYLKASDPFALVLDLVSSAVLLKNVLQL
jgi:hypothetical protein